MHVSPAVRVGGVPVPPPEKRIVDPVVERQGITRVFGGKPHFGNLSVGQRTRDAEDFAQARAEVMVHRQDKIDRSAAAEKERLFFGFSLRFSLWCRLVG